MIEFRTVPGFDNYECSRCGLIRSKSREVFSGKGMRVIEAQMMYGGKSVAKKKMCIKDNNGVKTTTTPQRLVYQAWHGEIPGNCGVTFVDGNTRNMHVDNLKLIKRGFTGAKPKAMRESRIYYMEGFSKLMADMLRVRWI